MTSLLLLRDKSACAIEGDEGIGSRFAGKQPVLDGKLSSPSTSTKRIAHPGASRNAGGLPIPFSHCPFFIYFPASIDGRGNASHIHSPLLYPPCAGGIIQPRVSSVPFLKGKILFVATASVPQNCLDVLPPSPQSPIATLAHGLERVLFK